MGSCGWITPRRDRQEDLVNNTWIAFASEAVAASMAFARRLGLENQTVVDALYAGPLVSPWQEAKLQRIAQGEFSAQFALSLALKDVRLALQAVDDGRFTALACLAEEWQQAADHGLGDQDPDCRDPRARSARSDTVTQIGYAMMGEQAGHQPQQRSAGSRTAGVDIDDDEERHGAYNGWLAEANRDRRHR
jgi:hypothetical protein